MYWKVHKPKTYASFYSPSLNRLPVPPPTTVVKVEIFDKGISVFSTYFKASTTKKRIQEVTFYSLARTFLLVHFSKIKKEVDKLLVKEML